MKAKNSVLALLFVFFAQGCANKVLDGAYPMGSTVPKESTIDERYKDVKADNTFIGGTENEELIDKDESNFTRADYTPFQEEKDQISKSTVNPLGSDHGYAGQYDKETKYLEINEKKLLRHVVKGGQSRMKISYGVSSDFNIKGRGGLYKSIFDANDSKNYGPVIFEIHKFVSKGFLEPFYGINTGFIYNEGNGIFSGGGTSTTVFKLWSIPVDVAFGTDINMGGYAKISLMGGPSVLGLMQSRNDFEEEEPKKRRRQIGIGYFAGAGFQISLSQLFKGYGFDLFKDSQITQMSLAVDYRLMNYSNFQDELEIESSSIGAGLVFEFL